MIEAVEKSLFEAIDSLDIEPALPFSFQNEEFNKPQDGKYVEFIHFRNERQDYSWNEDDGITKGIMQFNIYWPNVSGTIAPNAIADQIVNFFKKGTVIFFEGGKITTELSSVMSLVANSDGTDCFTPVRIPYRVNMN